MKRVFSSSILLKEWLFFASIAGVVVTSVYVKKIPSFSKEDAQVIFTLATLFMAVKGLENSGFLSNVSQGIEQGRFIALKLTCLTFFASMFLTNDAALIVIVPLTLALNTFRKDILVIIETLAANAGSALTPFGNPQNLFISWHYHVRPVEFMASILPFSLVFFILLLIASLSIRIPAINSANETFAVLPGKSRHKTFVYGILLLIAIMTALCVLPVQVGVLVILYPLLFDRRSLRIDYVLLLTLVCFLCLSANMKAIFASNLEDSGHIFIFSALSSQIISNVPAALLFAKFTSHWRPLLWGTSVGGFGGPVGSLANLIAYKLYLAEVDAADSVIFTTKFILLGYAAFFIGIGLYFTMTKMQWMLVK